MNELRCDADGCGRPAKWMSPQNRPLCGIHRRSVDTMYRQHKQPERCRPIEETE